MQKTRSWQESFDRLEAARRKKRQALDADARQLRDAEAASAKAAAARAEQSAAPILTLVSATPDCDDLVVRPRRRSKAAAGQVETAPRKRVKARRTVAKAKARTRTRISPKAAKPRVARQGKVEKPLAAALAPVITPLPRSAALAPYRKIGLFGLIGSWLRFARRQAAGGLAGSLQAKPRATVAELAELKAENERLRRQLEALLALPPGKPNASASVSAKSE